MNTRIRSNPFYPNPFYKGSERRNVSSVAKAAAEYKHDDRPVKVQIAELCERYAGDGIYKAMAGLCYTPVTHQINSCCLKCSIFKCPDYKELGSEGD
jgi:hypothetical protein